MLTMTVFGSASRRTRLIALRATLPAALLPCCPAALLALAPPAHAQPVCTVNGASGTMGTNGDDRIICTGNVDVLVEGRGDNDNITISGIVFTRGGVGGGSGDDTIFTGIVSGRFGGDDGNDTIITDAVRGLVGGQGAVLGGAGNDDIAAASVGSTGSGVVDGGSGDDRIRGIGGVPLVVGPGFGTVNGGADTDTCTIQNTGRGGTVNCEARRPTDRRCSSVTVPRPSGKPSARS
ncbi:hypothetical protein ACFW2T_12335 [Streptomyces sp. NPDC058892]|uniref:hypothetical protein n=1 Tax=unclassified Streptomyces TaxID=2593676 RepID=UPI0036CCE6A6